MTRLIQTRPATDDEIRHEYRHWIADGRRVRFRHFVGETLCARAEHGVAHRQYSNAALIDRPDGLFVRHHRRLERVTATHCTLTSTGREFVGDLRIASEYLPSKV